MIPAKHRDHLPVERYVNPEAFESLRLIALETGFCGSSLRSARTFLLSGRQGGPGGGNNSEPEDSNPTTLITVNGETYEVPGGWRIADLLLDLGIGYVPVSVARNVNVVPWQSYEDIPLQSNDHIEYKISESLIESPVGKELQRTAPSIHNGRWMAAALTHYITPSVPRTR